MMSLHFKIIDTHVDPDARANNRRYLVEARLVPDERTAPLVVKASSQVTVALLDAAYEVLEVARASRASKG